MSSATPAAVGSVPTGYNPEEYRMTVGEHLEELRKRMFLGLGGFMAAFFVFMVPAIGELIIRTSATQGCILARMSGSGATVFGLFGSSAQAHQAAHDLREAFPGYWVAAAPIIAAR